MLSTAQDLALAWKPKGWTDVELRRKDSKDFLAWAKGAIHFSATVPLPIPMFTLGRASCGVSLLAGSSKARDMAKQFQAEGLLVMSYAMLVAGKLSETSCDQLLDCGLAVDVLKSSEGLRHGVLSLVTVRTTDNPAVGVPKMRALLQESGHPLKGPGGGKAWNSQVTVSAISMPGLSASVGTERLEHLAEVMEVDAARLERYHGPLLTSKSLFDAEGNGSMSLDGLHFNLRSNVFVPRGESRHLIEAASRAIETIHAHRPRLLDVTVGVGNGLLPLLKRYPFATGMGIDINPTATRLAEQNAQLNGLAERCSMQVKDLKDWTLPATYDLVIANPPYSASKAERLESYQQDMEDAARFAGGSILVSIAQLAISALVPTGRLVLQVPREETTPLWRMTVGKSGRCWPFL